ncbi:MAG: precorrin-3B C(17)-methyltransferase [Alphaproteobacteria bacterium]|nr:precorrin-3B C(17)-methyltransferase [Alphaproteobacteria bacterium]
MDRTGNGAARLAIVCLVPATLPLARRLAEILGRLESPPMISLYGKRGRVMGAGLVEFDSTAPLLQRLFADGMTIIAICAAGIVVRALASQLAGEDSGHKSQQPAVLAVAADGSVIVPLLGGHGGVARHGVASGNGLARYLAAHLPGAVAAVTTASEAIGLPVLDDPPAGWRIAGYESAPEQLASLLRDLVVAAMDGDGPRVTVESGDGAWLAGLPSPSSSRTEILVTHRAVESDGQTLVYHPPVLALGLGGIRGLDPPAAMATIDRLLAEACLSMASVAVLVSHEIKADEAAFHQLAAHYGKPLRFFTAAALLAQTDRLSQRSEAVFAATGCYGVAEGAALAAVGDAGRLLLPKAVSDDRSLTVAVAISGAGGEITAPGALGKTRGKLTVVGIGPGRRDWLTPAVQLALHGAELVVGYGLYLGQIEDLIAGKPRFEAPLGAETLRVTTAIAAAADGRNTVLVSSGDAGIYGLAALVLEQLEAATDARSRRIELVVEPGISAVQAAAGRLGGAIGHDFALVSLSDLLTPWPVIEQRLAAAATGDFVLALYNPRSQQRDWQLTRAMEILAPHRPATTPVAIARNLGRAGESVSLTSLGEFDPTQVDMLSLVLVGNCQSRTVNFGAQNWLLTPRGYSSKNRRESVPILGKKE